MLIFSLHWTMQNISVLMSPRSPLGFTDIKKPNVLHHPVQAKNLIFNPYIYILYFQSNILNYHPPKFADYH